MKVQIKDLKPNPFRDIDNYPINEEKVQSLINSINQTGFWDNILARKNNGNIQIAYGHHRLIALWKIYGKTSTMVVNIPVKELDDSMMIRIMANENMEQWKLNPTIIDETVKVTREFLFKHQEIVRKLDKSTLREKREFDLSNSIGSKIIARFLGENWKIDWINSSLLRIKMEEKGELDKEAVESLPTERAARDFAKATKQIKNTTPEQQRRAAKNIIENQSFGESAVKSVLLDEKYKDMETEKSEREKVRIKARDFVHSIAKDLEKINEKIRELIKRKSEPNFDVYEDCIEAEEFTCEVKIFINNIKKLGGEKNEN